MTTGELLILARDALAADQALDAWCQSSFGKAATIMLGFDERSLEIESACPFVAIVKVNQLRGDSQRDLRWEVFIGAAVINGGILTDGNKQTYSGMLQAESLRELAENAIFRARLADITSASDASTESYFPLFVSETMLTFTQFRSTRKGLP